MYVRGYLDTPTGMEGDPLTIGGENGVLSHVVVDMLGPKTRWLAWALGRMRQEPTESTARYADAVDDIVAGYSAFQSRGRHVLVLRGESQIMAATLAIYLYAGERAQPDKNNGLTETVLGPAVRVCRRVSDEWLGWRLDYAVTKVLRDVGQ